MSVTLPTIASSGLAAAQARLDASANNIANVATPNYRPRR
jgi:flagellar basal body rod protein FlgG